MCSQKSNLILHLFYSFKHNLLFVLQLINAHPSVKYLWANKTSNLLSITKLLGAFAIQFAPEGSNMLPSEEKSYQIFVNYIREVAGHYCT